LAKVDSVCWENIPFGKFMSAKSVTTTPSLLDLSAEPDLGTTGYTLIIQNLGAGDVYAGYTNSVSTSNGLKIAAGMVWEVPAYQPSRPLYLVASTGTCDVRYLVVG
jgi:hypothetical protein